MSFDRLKEAKKKIENSKKLRTLIGRYEEVTNPSRCDKHALTFGGDSRFSVFSIPIFLDCHTGYYGDSNCSTLTSIDNGLAEKAMNAALNKNMALILSSMSDFLDEEAKAVVVSAKKELMEANSFLDEVSNL